MVDENKDAFSAFKKLHDRYALEGDSMQDEYNKEGKKILSIIQEYENKLCKNSEKTYSLFTGNLAEKFREEIRKAYPMIDHIGIIVKSTPSFNIKKISLS